MKPQGLRAAVAVAVGVLCLWHAPSPAQGQAGGKRVQLSPSQAMKLLYQQRRYADCKQVAYTVLWKDMEDPEALFFAGACLEKLKQNEDAAAFVHILQRVLEAPKLKDSKAAPQLRKWSQQRLKVLDVAFRAAQKKHLAESAAGRTFTSPQDADDLWMTHVRCDLRCLHGLYAWKMVGGRRDMAKDWIHNVQGRIHRSGGKYLDEVHGRKGVLFTVPLKKSDRPARLFVKDPGGAELLRIGVRAYNFPFVLNVVAEGKEVFSKTIGPKEWEDLKVRLAPGGRKEADIVLELVVPEQQRWYEGVFFDYVEFFKD